MSWSSSVAPTSASLAGERVAEVEDGARLRHQRVRLGLVVAAEGELSVVRGGRSQLPSEVFDSEGVEREGAAAGLDQIRGESGVHGDPADPPAVLGGDPHRALGVVQHLGVVRRREPAAEGLLVGLVELGGVEPGGGAVGRGQRDLADAARAERPGVHEGDAERLVAVLGQPGGQLAGGEDRAVQFDARLGGRGLVLDGAGVDGEQPLAQARVADLQHFEESGEGRPVVRGALQVLRGLRQLDGAHQLGEMTVELDRVQVLAQALADLALDLVGALHQIGEGTELIDPLRGRLLADLGNAGEIVRRIAAQRGEVRILRRLSARTSRGPSPG